MTIIASRVLLHRTQANCFELVVRQSHGRPQERQNQARCQDLAAGGSKTRGGATF